MFKYLVLYCLAGFLIVVDEEVSACRCSIVEETDRFCAAEFAAIVQVKDDGELLGNERVYRITELKNIKPVTVPYTVIRNKVFTADNSGACGAILDRHAIFLLAGHHLEDDTGRTKRHLGLCSVVRKLSKHEMINYRPPTC